MPGQYSFVRLQQGNQRDTTELASTTIRVRLSALLHQKYGNPNMIAIAMGACITSSSSLVLIGRRQVAGLRPFRKDLPADFSSIRYLKDSVHVTLVERLSGAEGYS